LGLEIENNKIEVTRRQQTNMPGIFAAGDCTPGIMQIAKAVGEGCTAALEAINYVRTWK
jgi:thioredoxin reductase (NADPH)